ncbi:Tannase/feruloyl esterase [Macrophomina phaseolina MS6]|uniref:Tannase/feruloyl esterase n=1 Tax=Macrophomina phaseolina (strain MS6) TaxID=1126212 RepID=K2S7H3_MACPH|nr:Tannase/feruloyl esterase [Macrophomina phaseolina MS6]
MLDKQGTLSARQRMWCVWLSSARPSISWHLVKALEKLGNNFELWRGRSSPTNAAFQAYTQNGNYPSFTQVLTRRGKAVDEPDDGLWLSCQAFVGVLGNPGHRMASSRRCLSPCRG